MPNKPIDRKKIGWVDHQKPLIVKPLEARNERVMTNKLDAGLVGLIFNDVHDFCRSPFLGGLIAKDARRVLGKRPKVEELALLIPAEVLPHLMVKRLS